MVRQSIRHFGLVLTVLTGFSLTAASAQAELLVNRFSAAADRGSHASFQPTAAAEPDNDNDALLDRFFHPVGLMMAVSFFPPGFPMATPPTPTAPPISPPGDPTNTVQVPGLPQSFVPPPVNAGTPMTQTVPTDPGTPTSGGSITPPPVQKSPEPGTFISGVLGAGLLGWMRWRRRGARQD